MASGEASTGRRVVVLGGGYCGSDVAARLERSGGLQVTLVDARPFALHKICGLRAAVDERWKAAVAVPRKRLKRTRVVVGRCVQVSESDVVMAQGERIPYDVLVCATGARNVSPGEPPAWLSSEAEVEAWFAGIRAHIARASRILVVGGGVVGVELAGELSELYSASKKVTLAHAGARLMDGMRNVPGASMQRSLRRQLRARNVDVLLGALAELELAQFPPGQPWLAGERVVKLSGGREVACDLVLLCTGTRPNSEMFPHDWLDAKGQLRVGPTLLCEARPNVLALGDITNLPEDKMLLFAQRQVATAVLNARALAARRGAEALRTHSSLLATYSGLIVVPLGSSGGAMQTPVLTLGAWVASAVKGSDLLTAKVFASLGARAPIIPKRPSSNEPRAPKLAARL